MFHQLMKKYPMDLYSFVKNGDSQSIIDRVNSL